MNVVVRRQESCAKEVLLLSNNDNWSYSQEQSFFLIKFDEVI